MYRFLVCILLTTSIIGCASKPTVSEIFTREVLDKNGPEILCSDELFTQCFSRSKQECLEDMTPHSASCMNKAKKNVGGTYISTKDDAKTYAVTYFGCMLDLKVNVKRAMEVHADPGRIASCKADHLFENYKFFDPQSK